MIDSNKSVLTAGEIRVMETLRDHPFLSRRQLELCLHRTPRMVRLSVNRLAHRGWVQRHNAHLQGVNARSLLSLTTQGVQALAKRAAASPGTLSMQAGLGMPRLERLLVMVERAFLVRTLLLWLQQSGPDWRWSMPFWDVEVRKLFGVGEKSFNVPFHGAAVMARPDGRWNTLVVEMDLRRAPIEKDRERLVHFVMAQDDRRYWKSEHADAFPVWVLVAQDEFRLQDYYTVLRAAALARRLPLPRAYLTTFSQMLTLRTNPGLPIWYSTTSGEKRPLLHDTPGSAVPLPTQPPWGQLTADPRHRTIETASLTGELLSQLAQGSRSTPTLAAIKCNPSALTLALKPVEKRMLDEIAAHPLLTASEIAQVLHLSAKQGLRGARRLLELDLIEPHSMSNPFRDVSPQSEGFGASPSAEARHLLTETAMRYLALIAGFENGVRRYAKARGWANGFDTLLRHWEHTREENLFFLGLAQIAQRRRHEFVWLSELESRLYYDSGSDEISRFERHRRRSENTEGRPTSEHARRIWRRSFLPDGRGTYTADGRRYDVALEIDRSRMTTDKVRRKLAEYYACLTANVLRSRGIERLRLLIVTSSWERAETLRRAVIEMETAFQGAGILMVLITTFPLLRSSGADRPIWLQAGVLEAQASALTAPKTYCLDAFGPQPKPIREPGRVTYLG